MSGSPFCDRRNFQFGQIFQSCMPVNGIASKINRTRLNYATRVQRGHTNILNIILLVQKVKHDSCPVAENKYTLVETSNACEHCDESKLAHRTYIKGNIGMHFMTLGCILNNTATYNQSTCLEIKVKTIGI